jgi:hypothetical protein
MFPLAPIPDAGRSEYLVTKFDEPSLVQCIRPRFPARRSGRLDMRFNACRKRHPSPIPGAGRSEYLVTKFDEPSLVQCIRPRFPARRSGWLDMRFNACRKRHPSPMAGRSTEHALPEGNA